MLRSATVLDRERQPLAEPFPHLLACLRAAADPSRLRLLAVCAQGEWTVSELVQVLGQSQPRISRHLKILAEAGLLDRFREGGWVFYRRAQGGEGARVARSLCRLLPDDDPALLQDRRRLAAVREARRKAAERYFDGHAAGWEEERDLAVDGAVVEAALRRIFEAERPASLLDVGTGTGRVLQVLAPHVGLGLGIDISRDMLAVARARLDEREARNCQVRQGDMYQLPLPDASFAAVTLHQVLHFADDPARVLAEAARVLAPGGRLVVVDLLRHGLERLREEKAHRRLGFAPDEMSGWLAELGLVEQPAEVLAGPELAVAVWTARRPARAGDDATTTTTTTNDLRRDAA
jgi:ubiquinone/menaquinone biosynthesis C-methylase UbiE